MLRAGIVEARGADHANARLAADTFHAAHDIMGRGDLAHGHEIRDLHNAILGKEASEQDVGIGQVKLFAFRAIEFGRDLKSAATLRVKEGGENSRRIETGKAEEIDGAIKGHEG